MKIVVREAVTTFDRLLAQHLIAQVYNESYGILFSSTHADLHARIEPFPHRYLMAFVGDELAGAVGLYTHDTYVARYGQVDGAMAAVLAASGTGDQYEAGVQREVTKLSVARRFAGAGVARALHRASHARAYLEANAVRPPVVVVCGKLSMLSHLYGSGPSDIRTRRLGEFPEYPVHAKYRSADDPMESHLLLPALDIPADVYERTLPAEFPFAPREAR